MIYMISKDFEEIKTGSGFINLPGRTAWYPGTGYFISSKSSYIA